MRRWNASLAGMLAAGALVLSGCGSSDAAPDGHATPAASSAAKHNAADVMFAQMMIPHHRQAVRMAELAHGKAGSTIAKLAARIKKEQGPEITKMSGWLRSWGKPVTDHGMDGTNHGDGMMTEADMKKLGGMSGAAFDRMFLTMMIKHHQGAVTMAKMERDGGTYPAARSLAASIIATQNKEINRMRDLLKSG